MKKFIILSGMSKGLYKLVTFKGIEKMSVKEIRRTMLVNYLQSSKLIFDNNIK